MKKRIGILSGLFDPVHTGHISMALAVINELNLDDVYFMVESVPRRKDTTTHVAHRIAMLKLATMPYAKLKVLEFPDKQFSVAKTMPRIDKKFEGDELYFICGADMLEHMPSWMLIDEFLKKVNLVVAIRNPYDTDAIKALLSKLPVKHKTAKIIQSPRPDVSSGKIRALVQKDNNYDRFLDSTKAYAKEHWLYVLPSSSSSDS